MSDKTNPLPKLLIVEDDPGLQAQLKWAYEDFEVIVVGDRAAALAALRTEAPAVVTLDLGLPPDPDGTSEGFAVLDEIMALKSDTKVIVATGHGARESALTAIAKGAYDFYHKPVDIEALGLIARRALQLHRIEGENRSLAAKVGNENRVLGSLITAAPEMVRVARTIERVANTNVSVMLLGASGTGKELLARGLHEASDRAGGPFVAINCAAIPETLLESELFGHEKGAFTGAVERRVGRFELADGGTLFLDEVGEIPPTVQAKLLLALERREVIRVGALRPRAFDVRFVSATNRDVEAGERLRPDLYYRLAGLPIHVPPLRERKGEIPALAARFVAESAKKLGRAEPAIGAEAMRALVSYEWPGNVRELATVVERALLWCGSRIDPEHFVLGRRSPGQSAMPAPRASDSGATPSAPPGPKSDAPPPPASRRTLAEDVGEIEKKRITDALEQCGGNQSRAAELLGISRRTLINRMIAFSMPRPRKP